jgi:hypothetical protein
VDTRDVTPENNPRGDEFLGLQGKFTALTTDWGAQFSQETLDLLNPATNRLIQVEYPVSSADYPLQAPAEWGARRAEGQLQANLRALVLAQAQLRQDARAYEAYVTELEEQADLLSLRYGLRRDQLQLKSDREITADTFNGLILAAKTTKVILEGAADDFEEARDALMEAVPDVVGLSDDAFAPIDAALYRTSPISGSSIPRPRTSRTSRSPSG